MLVISPQGRSRQPIILFNNSGSRLYVPRKDEDSQENNPKGGTRSFCKPPPRKIPRKQTHGMQVFCILPVELSQACGSLCGSWNKSYCSGAAPHASSRVGTRETRDSKRESMLRENTKQAAALHLISNPETLHARSQPNALSQSLGLRSRFSKRPACQSHICAA